MFLSITREYCSKEAKHYKIFFHKMLLKSQRMPKWEYIYVLKNRNEVQTFSLDLCC